jgi:hypothetical protein
MRDNTDGAAKDVDAVPVHVAPQPPSNISPRQQNVSPRKSREQARFEESRQQRHDDFEEARQEAKRRAVA